MHSPVTDDYAGLVAPWHPITDLFLKDPPNLNSRIEFDNNTKKSIDTISSFNDAAQYNDLEISSTISTATNNVIDDGAQYVSDTEILGSPGVDEADIYYSFDHDAQTNYMNLTDTDDDTSQHIDIKCVAVSTCVANSEDHRKVVSHIFGRNKSCTRDLPNNLWIYWCRKHYQRFKYRAEDAEKWHTRQMELVRQQLRIFENWGQVRSWTIALRKAEHDAIIEENKRGENYTSYLVSCWERFLVPYLGPNKSFAKVREVLDVIQRKFEEGEYEQRPKKMKTFPGVEFLPTIHKAKEAKKPAAKKGEITYKKITLDQPAFNRKTRANAQYIKEMAAKKSQSSKIPKRSGTASSKTKSPDIDNHSEGIVTIKRETSTAIDNGIINSVDTKYQSIATTTATGSSSSKATKRKAMDPVYNTPLADQNNIQPTKRRRLTRGFEKHGSEGDDATLMEQ